MHGEVRHSHGDLATRVFRRLLAPYHRRPCPVRSPAPRSGPRHPRHPLPAPHRPPGPRAVSSAARVAPLALVLLTALVYARSLGVPIHDWDDHVYFFRDVRVEHPSAENVGRILVEPFFSNYHPVTTLTIAFDRAVWRTWVPGFHLTHLFFYAGGVLGIYLLFARILRRRAEAFVGAAIYAVHAVHVESVAWLASRKDVVCLFFSTSSPWSRTRAVRRRRAGPMARLRRVDRARRGGHALEGIRRHPPGRVLRVRPASPRG